MNSVVVIDNVKVDGPALGRMPANGLQGLANGLIDLDPADGGAHVPGDRFVWVMLDARVGLDCFAHKITLTLRLAAGRTERLPEQGKLRWPLCSPIFA